MDILQGHALAAANPINEGKLPSRPERPQEVKHSTTTDVIGGKTYQANPSFTYQLLRHAEPIASEVALTGAGPASTSIKRQLRSTRAGPASVNHPHQLPNGKR
jgi:hypothetical protein